LNGVGHSFDGFPNVLQLGKEIVGTLSLQLRLPFLAFHDVLFGGVRTFFGGVAESISEFLTH
jgi:hypothetical protein